MTVGLPSDAEQQVLLAVWRLGENAYGVPVRDELERLAERSLPAGAVYTSLVRLEHKGWLSSSMGNPTPERGGKSKRFFQITGEGMRVLHTARSHMDRLWDGLEVAELLEES
jgi:PadR family transcriptional regulator PadR